MIRPLPKWVLTNRYPAFYDTESVTAIEMVAKLYGSMEELITDYNKFVDETNKAIQDFEDGIIKSFDEFKACVTKIMEDYIETIDTKINMQDKAIADKFAEQDENIANKFAEQDEIIAEAVDYMKTNLIQTVTNLFEQCFEQGLITTKVSVMYHPETEELTILDTMTKAEDGEY